MTRSHRIDSGSQLVPRSHGRVRLLGCLAGVAIAGAVAGCSAAQQQNLQNTLDCVSKIESRIPMNPNSITLADAIRDAEDLHACLKSSASTPDAGK